MTPMPRLSRALTVTLTTGLCWLALAGAGLAQQAPAAQTPLAAPTGDATRGKTLFEQTLRCYACHGFDGQTGSPRLVPMARSQEVFLAYVRKPATQGMPSFRDAAERDLVDVYAYIRSIPVAAPPADSIPLLKAITDRRAAAK
jgi:mono/diheme cytochrome c family protein